MATPSQSPTYSKSTDHSESLCFSPMVTEAKLSVRVAHLTGDREAGASRVITSCSYQPFLLQMESATIACFEAGLLSSPSLFLHNPSDWNTLQGIMLLGERSSACAGFGQPSTTPMSYFTWDLAITCILIIITFSSAGPGLNVMPEPVISHPSAKPSFL